MERKKIKPYLTLICFVILIIFITFYATKAFLPSISTTNIVNNKLVDWGIGWKNKQSFYSGSELEFKFNNSRRISFEFSTTSKADQGAEILIDNDKYFISSPNLNNQQLSISVNNNEPHTVRIRHFCTFLYFPCNITLKNVYLDNHSELIPYKSNKKVLSILGDSISTIYGKENYSFMLADSLDYELHNASVLSSTVSKISDVDNAIKRYKKDMMSFKSDMIIIFLGTNDAARNVPFNDFEKDYSKIVSDIKSFNPNTKIFLVGILKRNDVNENILQNYNNIIKNVAEKNKVYFIDPLSWLDKNDLSDNIHPSIEAQKKLSEKFLEAISTRIK
ncbi:MAG: SGNH/GDSL hydrolase family protein [Patescibacteria group bacterium]